MTGKNPDTGKNLEKGVNLFINFQLTNKRAKYAKAVMQARSKQQIHKYYISQNGKIKVKTTNDPDAKYMEVKSEAHLTSQLVKFTFWRKPTIKLFLNFLV